MSLEEAAHVAEGYAHAGILGWPGTAVTGVYEWWVEGKPLAEIGAKAAGGAAGTSLGIELGGLAGAPLGRPGVAGEMVFEWLAH